MSRTVSADLEAMIEFRSHLIRFNQLLAEEFSSIHAHWQSLGDVWDDDKYRQFGHALDEVQPGIQRYLAATDDHEAHLLRLIENLRRFLET